MTKRIIGKLHPVRYVVQDNMLFGCIPFIYITRKTFSTVDEARKYVGEPCDEYLFYYRIDYEFYICNHILYENYVSLSI